MGKATREFCKAVRERQRKGEITKQQARTIMGQAKAGDIEGAARGLERACKR